MAIAEVVRLPGLAPLASSIGAAIDGFLSHCRARRLSPETLQYYYHRLRAFTQFLERCPNGPPAPKDVTPQLIRAFVTSEAERTSPATANHAVTALRTFFGYLVREGFLETNPMDSVEKLRCKRRLIDTFTLHQVEAVLATCGKDFVGVRDRAIVLTLIDCGLRVSELCGLTLDDISWTEQTMLVCGKGDKERVVPFGQATRQALLQYLTRRGDLPTKALFVNCYGSGLDRYRVREIIAERCKTAGITGVRCSPHTLRHTFAVQYLRNGGDTFSLQRLLGHADLTMTRRYAELSQSDVIEKHRQFSLADRLNVKPTGGKKRLR